MSDLRSLSTAMASSTVMECTGTFAQQVTSSTWVRLGAMKCPPRSTRNIGGLCSYKWRRGLMRITRMRSMIQVRGLARRLKLVLRQKSQSPHSQHSTILNLRLLSRCDCWRGSNWNSTWTPLTQSATYGTLYSKWASASANSCMATLLRNCKITICRLKKPTFARQRSSSNKYEIQKFE